METSQEQANKLREKDEVHAADLQRKLREKEEAHAAEIQALKAKDSSHSEISDLSATIEEMQKKLAQLEHEATFKDEQLKRDDQLRRSTIKYAEELQAMQATAEEESYESLTLHDKLSASISILDGGLDDMGTKTIKMYARNIGKQNQMLRLKLTEVEELWEKIGTLVSAFYVQASVQLAEQAVGAE